MKFKAILSIAAALSLTACAHSSKISLPPSTPVSAPPSTDTAPVEKVEPIANGEMGTVTEAYGKLLQQYGTLGVRFNTFREFYDCVRKQINDHKPAKTCL
jgi:predicted small lipoprotein YifL